jgi:hypothetical protein
MITATNRVPDVMTLAFYASGESAKENPDLKVGTGV